MSQVTDRPAPAPSAADGSLTGMPRPLARLVDRARATAGSVRLRLVWWFIVVLAVTTVVSVLAVRLILAGRVDARIESEIREEVSEVQLLSSDNDPQTGRPFGPDVARIFEVALERNVPAPNEVLFTFVDGVLVGQSGGRGAPLLSDVPVETWAALTESTRGRLALDDGRSIDYMAVPFHVDGAARGVFVVALDRALPGSDLAAASLAATAVGLVMLVVGSVLAFRLAGRILAPVREVRRTAQAISVTDLSRRIEVDGHDEIARLAETFNEMLDRLDDAFETQRRFIDDASHELRTPVTVIRGHLDTLGDDPEERARTLALLDDELERMRRLVDDLITLARSDRPGFLRPGPVDLGDLTREILDKARVLGARTWVLDAAADVPIEADAQRLTQAMLQLSENAVRHTSPGSRISIGSALVDGSVRLWVTDTGSGVAAEDRERIFERFVRGRAGRRRGEGSGLGLSIVGAIADAHGGTVEVESPPGAGATFTIVIPGPRGAPL